MCQNRVMIVDDEASIRRTISSVVTAVGCVVVCEAENGKRAIELFDPNEVDVVIIDMHMPGIRGWEAVKAMKSKIQGSGRDREIAFVFVFSPKGCGQMISMFGCYDVILPKPFNARLLQSVVSTKIRR